MAAHAEVDPGRPPLHDRVLYRLQLKRVDSRWRDWLVEDLGAPGAARRYEATETGLALVLMLVTFGLLATINPWVAVAGCLVGIALAALRVGVLSKQRHEKRRERVLKWHGV